MKEFNITITKNIKLTEEDIDDIMSAALDGGISYWVCKAEVVGEYLGDYASDQISRGGTLKLYDAEEDNVYELTLEKLLEGFKLWIADGYNDSRVINDGEVDTYWVDGLAADQITQLALFEDIIYG
jgi:hypothetical protein